MNIEAKFSCKDIVGPLREGAYEVPDDADVRKAMECVYAEDGREMPASVTEHITFIVNSKRAQWETKLSDGDKLRVLYRFLGG